MILNGPHHAKVCVLFTIKQWWRIHPEHLSLLLFLIELNNLIIFYLGQSLFKYSHSFLCYKINLYDLGWQSYSLITPWQSFTLTALLVKHTFMAFRKAMQHFVLMNEQIKYFFMSSWRDCIEENTFILAVWVRVWLSGSLILMWL